MKKRVLAEFTQSQVKIKIIIVHFTPLLLTSKIAELLFLPIILFFQVIEPPIKRLKTLRLSTTNTKNGTESSSALAYIECLEKCKSGNDALQLLVRISDAIAYIAAEDVPIAVKKLVERFAVENEAAVRAKIFWVFAELGEVTPDIAEKAKIINETTELLRNEESHRVKSQGLATLLKLGDYQRYIYHILCNIYFFFISNKIYI